MSNKFSKSAFSLVELSIVLLIIGIIVVGISAGNQLINVGELNKARAYTKSGPVNSIKSLQLWLETTSKNSFSVSQPVDGDIVSWNDINQLSVKDRSVTVETAPAYVENSINGLPALVFDGTDHISFDAGSILTSDELTIFAVVGNKELIYVFGSDTTVTAAARTHLTWGPNSANVSAYHNRESSSNLLFETEADAVSDGAHILALRMADGGVREVFIDNGTPITITDPLIVTQADTNYYIGRYGTNYSAGMLTEVIMYNRALSDDEMDLIEQYLSAKWDISIN